MLNGQHPETGSDSVIDFGHEGGGVAGTSDSDVRRRQRLDTERGEMLVRMFLPDVRFAIDQAADAYLLHAKGLGAEIPDHSPDVTDIERIMNNATRRDALQEVLGGVVVLEDRPDIGPGKEKNARPAPWSYEEAREALAVHIATHLAARQMASLASDHAVLDMNNAQSETATIMTRIFEYGMS